MIRKIILISFLLISFCEKAACRDFAALYQQSTLSPKRKLKLARPVLDDLESPEELISFILPVELFKKGPYQDALRAYYKGKKYTLQDGIFSLQAPKNLDEFELIIGLVTAPVELPFSGLMIAVDEPYHRYTLKQHLDFTTITHSSWYIEKHSGLGPLIIPDNTLVINADPRYIKSVTTQSWPHDHPSKMLPKLVLNNIITQDEGSVRIALSNLDSDPFYETQKLAFAPLEKKQKEIAQEKE